MAEFITLRDLLSSWNDAYLTPTDGDSLFDKVGIEDIQVRSEEESIFFGLTALVDAELGFSPAGAEDLEIVFASNQTGVTAVDVETLFTSSGYSVQMADLNVVLRLPPGLFRPVTTENGQFEVIGDPDKPFEIKAQGLALMYTSTNGLQFGANGSPPSLGLDPVMIGNTGIIIAADEMQLFFLRDLEIPAELPANFQGIFLQSAAIHLTGPLADLLPDNLTFGNCAIGSGGFTGQINHTFATHLQRSLFGMDVGLTRIQIDIRQNAMAAFTIQARVDLPFFDEEVDLEFGLDLDGNLLAKISDADGLIRLSNNIFDFEVSSIDLQIEDDVLSFGLGGNLTPVFGGLDWPSFEIERLALEANGHIHLEGGWLDLPRQFSLDFHGFQMEITQLGFGYTGDDGKWVGFSGSIHLTEGLPAGASVEGLRIAWYTDGREPKISFDGVGVELEVPNVCRFKGDVSYRQFEEDQEVVHRFDGDIKFLLIPLNLEIDAELVVGTARGDVGRYNFMAIYLGIELPVGIPLYTSGLSLYGMAGLFAMQMEPDKQPDEKWYGIGQGEGWYKRPPIGATELEKWTNERGSLAVGAGVTIGTVFDNGFSFNSRMLLVLVFPGPIIMLEGKANVLRRCSRLDEEPVFRALAVLDQRENTFTAGLDAEYKYGPGGRLMLIQGSAEVFFSFNDPMAWHLYIGMKEPREKRIRARSFDLFETNAYFMLDARRVAFGLWNGYDNHWKFGPVRLVFEAWLEGNAALSYRPPQFYGDIAAHGKILVAVWRFEFGLSADARLETTVFDPFHIKAEIGVKINLPWPLPDLSAEIAIEWGPELERPQVPAPLKEVAIEHFKITDAWHLPIHGIDESEPDNIPVVPLDARPHLAFVESMKDVNLIGVNTTEPEPPRVVIGDPQTGEGSLAVEYSLVDVSLEKKVEDSYHVVASKTQAIGDMFGSWAPVPVLNTDGNPADNTSPGPISNTKLWIWSKNPFEYFRRSSSSWQDWLDRHTDANYPCPVAPPDKQTCYDFESVPIQEPYMNRFHHPEHPGFSVRWSINEFHWVDTIPFPMTPYRQGWLLRGPKPGENIPDTYLITLPQTAAKVELYIQIIQTFGGPDSAVFKALSTSNVVLDQEGLPFSMNQHSYVVTLQTNNNQIKKVRMQLNMLFRRFYLVAVCIYEKPPKPAVERVSEIAEHLQESLERWSVAGTVLEPHSDYRLKITTRHDSEGIGRFDFDSRQETLENTVYFRTQGPPGLVDLSLPDNPAQEVTSPSARDNQGLSDLSLYVDETIPDTLSAEGVISRLPKPVYRAYDVGVIFNEDYVAQMYKMAGRDLNIYLFNCNNQPVRDADGRLIVLNNRWVDAGESHLTQSELRYLKSLIGTDCLHLDLDVVPLDNKLMAVDPGQVLDPDTVYEARLVPLLFAEDFLAPNDHWQLVTEGTNLGPAEWEWNHHDKKSGKLQGIEENTLTLPAQVDLSDLDPGFDVIYLSADTQRPTKTYRILHIDQAQNRLLLDGDPATDSNTNWEIPAVGAIVQTSNVWGGQNNAAEIAKPGTLFLLQQLPTHTEPPTEWTDYRFTVVMHPMDDDGIGVVFRHTADGYLRFSMDKQREFRRLVKFQGDSVHLLAADDFEFEQDTSYIISVETIGESIRIYQNGHLVFDVVDGDIRRGTIGFYSWAHKGARFSNVRVEDFSELTTAAYRFEFTTSWFANFFHHIHSFQNETWSLTADDGFDMAPAVDEAKPANTIPNDAEHRHYHDLAEALLGSAAMKRPPEIQISQIQQNQAVIGWLLQSPEPLIWNRLEIALKRAPIQVNPHQPPTDIKLTQVKNAMPIPAREFVDLVIRSKRRLQGIQIQHPLFPDLLLPLESEAIFSEDFHNPVLPGWSIVDRGTKSAPSKWAAEDGVVRQLSNIHTPANQNALLKQGTQLLADPLLPWNGILTLRMRSDDNDEIGVLLRYRNDKNHYRFVMNQQAGKRRLIRVKGGLAQVLWEDQSAYQMRKYYDLIVVYNGHHFQVYIDGLLALDVKDPSPLSGAGPVAIRMKGRIGLFCWANSKTYFSRIRVYELANLLQKNPQIFHDNFSDNTLAQWEIIDEVQNARSDWVVEDGVLHQRSNIHGGSNAIEDPSKPGTYLLSRQSIPENFRFQTTLSSDDNDAIGVLFNYQDPDNYYWFLMDRQRHYRRLVKKENGQLEILWEDVFTFNLGRPYVLTIDRFESSLTGYLDGIRLFALEDSIFVAGKVGLYCWANTGANFYQVTVGKASWQTYYSFDVTQAFPDGTQFRIYSGNRNAADAAAFAGQTGFVASIGQEGKIHFPAAKARLRVIDDAGKVLDDQTFLRSDHFESVDMKILRKRDGTGLFILPSDPALTFKPGSYRLDVKFRRDNTALEPDSQILQQAGDRTDEVARLYIPWETKN